MNKMPTIDQYREYNPYTESILSRNSGVLIVIDRYGINDYGAWFTDRDHLYDESFGSSVRGSFDAILEEIRNVN